jgi:hypothetical protein
VDRWLKESIDRLWRESLKKLRIHEEDIVTEQNKQLQVVYLSLYLLDRPESPANRRTKVGNFFRMLIDSAKAWLSLDDGLDDEEWEIGQEDWKMREGRDHLWRFTEFAVIFVHLTREFMGYYECDYNFLRDKVLVERFGHHFYEDIVAVWMEEEARSRNLLPGTKVIKFQTLKIWLRGSENIERTAPAILFIPRKLLDRLIWRSRKYEILESKMDVVVKNLNAMLDNQKQRRFQNYTASSDPATPQE